MVKIKSLGVALLAALLAASAAHSQAVVGGNTSISVSGSSANVQLPVSVTTYPALMLVPATGTTVEIFYALGSSNSVTATTNSAAVPSGGVCIILNASNTWLAAIGGGSATLRVTQLRNCPQFAIIKNFGPPPPTLCLGALDLSAGCAVLVAGYGGLY